MITHRLFVALLAVGVAGGCSHQQSTQTGTLPPPAVAAAPRAAAASTRTPAPAPASAPAPADAGKGAKELAVFFDFDSALLRDDARPVLQTVATVAQSRTATVRIEGNCDELGTVEYNLALGEHRAIQARDYLTKLGVPPTRIRTVSYGSQRPKMSGHDEQARAQNRRDDFIVQ